MRASRHLRFAVAALCGLAAACGDSSSPRGDSGSESRAAIRAAVTVPPLAQWLSGLGGEDVEVTLLLPAGRSPHMWNPTPSMIEAVRSADLAVAVGGGLDPWSQPRFATVPSDSRAVEIVPRLVARGLIVFPSHAEAGEEDGHAHGDFDPHVWLDPALAAAACAELTEVLCELAPDRSATLRARGEEFQARLRALADECAARGAAMGPRRMVTFHRAWDHLADALGWEVVDVIERAPGIEPSLREMGGLIERLRAGGADLIVAEMQFRPAIAERLAEATGLPLVVLDPLGDPEESVETLFRANLDRLEGALSSQ
jgi:zinc transport system substrate-binding protein